MNENLYLLIRFEFCLKPNKFEAQYHPYTSIFLKNKRNKFEYHNTQYGAKQHSGSEVTQTIGFYIFYSNQFLYKTTS